MERYFPVPISSYPSDFRDTYGRETLLTVREKSFDVHRKRGVGSSLWTCGRALVDVFHSRIAEYLDEWFGRLPHYG